MAVQLDERTIRKIINDIENSEYRDRREDEYKAFEVYSGALKNHTKNELQQLFPESWSSMRMGNVSFSKKIVDKLSKAYKTDPIRALESDENTSTLADIYREGNFNRTYKHLDQLFNLHRFAALWVTQDPNGAFNLRALAPYQFAVVRDQVSGDVDAFVVNFPTAEITHAVSELGDGLDQIIAEDQSDTSATTNIYGIWTPTQHVAVKTRSLNTSNGAKRIEMEMIPLPNNPNNINPLGIIPFVFLTKDQSVDLPLLSPITDQTIDLNVLLSDVLTASALQGFSELVLKFEEGSKIERVTTGLTTAISLPQPSRPDAPPTEASYINPSPDLAGQKDVIMSYLKMILAEHGITSSQNVSGDQSFTSGLDRLLSQADVQSQVEENQNMYQGAENGVFQIIKAHFAARNSGQFKGEENLSVIYPKPQVLISDGETLDNIKKRLDLGLIQKFEALQLIDPNLNETQAKEKLERINEEKSESADRFFNSSERGRSQVPNSEVGDELFTKP